MNIIYFIATMIFFFISCSNIIEADVNKKLEEIKILSNPKVVDSKNVMIPDGGAGANLHASKSFDERRNELKSLCFRDEEDFLEINNQLISALKEKIRNHSEGLAKIKITDYLYPKYIRENDGIKEYIGERKYSGNKNETYLSNYVEQFRKLHSVELDVFKVLSSKHMRDGLLRMKEANLYVRAEINGSDKVGSRMSDTLWLLLRVNKTENKWNMGEIRFLKLSRLLTNRPPYFTEVKSPFNSKLKNFLRTEAIRRGGYALALSDINKDNNLDLFVGHRDESQFFLGDGKGSFAINNMIPSYSYVKSAVFADFENKGFQDLLITRFLVEKPLETDKKRNDIVILKNNNGEFSEQEVIDKSVTDYAMPSAVSDFNNDGRLDFYVGFPGAKDFTFTADIAHPANQKVQGTYFNQGNYSFLPKKLLEIDYSSFHYLSHRQKVFPHSALAFDLNSDQSADLLVVDDRANLSPIYFSTNKNDGHFEDMALQVGISQRGYGMGVAISDYDNDGAYDILTSKVNFLATHRINDSCSINWGVIPVRQENAYGLQLYKGTKNNRFMDSTLAAGLEWAGEGLAGVEFIDYNSDGLQDIFVSNGLWSGTNKYEDLSSYFVRMDEKTEQGARRSMMEARRKSQSDIMDILSNFKGTIFPNNITKSMDRPHMAGFQRKKLFRNNGDGTFTDVAFLEGVDSIADGYTIAKGDINNDNHIDIVLRNADPGTEAVNFQPIQVFINQNPSKNNTVKMKLIGSSSNRDAVMTDISIKTNGLNQRQQVIANNGCVQSEKSIYFGIGKNNSIQEAQIIWPSGEKQKLHNLKSGIHTITEPQKRIISKLPNKLAIKNTN